MAHFDLPLDQLCTYVPPRPEPADFDEFWRSTLDTQDRDYPLEVTYTPVDTGYTEIHTDDVTFSGFGGQPIKGWLHRPARATGPLPTVVTFIGYGGGRGLSHEHIEFAAAGYAHFIMDNRGQGSAHQIGDTGDAGTTGPQASGFLTSGIDAPETYFYRRIFVDAERAVRAARRHPFVDPEQVMISGGSQGAALCMAAGALTELRGLGPAPLRAAIVDVPFLSHVRHATTLTNVLPYQEIVTYLKAHRDKDERVFATLSYFDGLNFAARMSIPALFSVGLMDEVCPPSTVYAAFNHYHGQTKEMAVYPYNGHENGGPFQIARHLKFAREALG